MDEKYWKKRSLDRLVGSEAIGEAALEDTLAVYDEALVKINRDIQDIYRNYSKNGVLDVAQLKAALTPEQKKKFLKDIQEAALKLGLNADEVFDERYLARLTRLQALEEQIRLEILATAPEQVKISEEAFTRVLNTAYTDMQATLALQGVSPGFAKLDKTVLDAILRSQWVGRNYAKSVWNNTDELARVLKDILGSALSSGQSYQKTARELRERFDVSRYEATRLVRTETNYFHNQAELQSYIDDGIEKYIYDAKLDGRTSPLCDNKTGLDGKVFKVKDAKPGKNYPPLHPHCRSTTNPKFPIIQGATPKKKQRTARLNVGETNQQIQDNYISKFR